MEQNKQKNSKRRLNSLILLVAFTAIMLIVSTYAWFSTQKNVSISNLQGTVKVAEGLEISLDANSWSQEIDFSQYSDDMTALKKKYGQTEHNVIPTELLPVSSNGAEGITPQDGTAVTEVPFYRGIATQANFKWKLETITKTEGVGSTKTASDVDFPGYYAIDLFLRNSGLKGEEVEGTAKETLQLSAGSKVEVLSNGMETTGLQNTPRVAFAMFNGSAGVTAAQADVLTGTVGAAIGISDVAIWEPNANAHVANSVTNFNDITWKTGEAAKYIADVNGKVYANEEYLPTYALTTGSVGQTYDDLYNWDGTTNAGLSKQISLQTAAGATDAVKNLISVKSAETSVYPIGKTGDTTQFQMLKNKTLRIRMYVWLEGQDPDCVNYASHGGGIKLNIGLCKGEDVG